MNASIPSNQAVQKKVLFLIFFSVLLLPLLSSLYSCNGVRDKPVSTTPESVDSITLSLNFIYGLWSLDSMNSLCNEGYYFRSDGTVDLVASELSGNWELAGKDSLLITYPERNGVRGDEVYHIDSLSAARMVLSSEQQHHVFRKVPYGTNPEGVVISGFAGSLAPGMSKEYKFNVPSTRDIQLRLQTENPLLEFRFFDEQEELTATAVKNWKGILIRGGQYSVRVYYPGKPGLQDEATDFNFKVLAF